MNYKLYSAIEYLTKLIVGKSDLIRFTRNKNRISIGINLDSPKVKEYFLKNLFSKN